MKNKITTIEGLAQLINETMASKEDIKDVREDIATVNGRRDRIEHLLIEEQRRKIENLHIPPNLVVRGITAHRKPPDVRICRLRNQSRVGTVPPSTSTPHCPACMARR